MRFTLTPEVIQLLFAEKPHVRRAFERSVPAHMSEKEFWTRYLKHELAKEVRGVWGGWVGGWGEVWRGVRQGEGGGHALPQARAGQLCA